MLCTKVRSFEEINLGKQVYKIDIANKQKRVKNF